MVSKTTCRGFESLHRCHGQGSTVFFRTKSEVAIMNLGWWTISGEELMNMLKRVHLGEDPGLVYTEAYINSDITDYSGSSEE